MFRTVGWGAGRTLGTIQSWHRVLFMVRGWLSWLVWRASFPIFVITEQETDEHHHLLPGHAAPRSDSRQTAAGRLERGRMPAQAVPAQPFSLPTGRRALGLDGQARLGRSAVARAGRAGRAPRLGGLSPGRDRPLLRAAARCRGRGGNPLLRPG